MKPSKSGQTVPKQAGDFIPAAPERNPLYVSACVRLRDLPPLPDKVKAAIG